MVDRIKWLLKDFELLRDDNEYFRQADLEYVLALPGSELVARQFMADAGYDLDDKRHVIRFLILLASHVYLDPRKFPYDKFTLLMMAYERLQSRASSSSHVTVNSIAAGMQQRDVQLRGWKPDTVRQALGRAIDALIEGELNLAEDSLGKPAPLNETQQEQLRQVSASLASLRLGIKKMDT